MPLRSIGQAVLLSALCSLGLSAAAPDSAAAVAILNSNCAQCHSKALSMSGLDLSSRDAALRGGSRGPTLVAGKAAESKLMEAVERKGKLVMPPSTPLSPTEVETLRRWIDEGAEWPEAAATTTRAPVSTWWAFQKVVRPVVPRSGDEWVRNPVDAFVLSQLKAEALRPSSRAPLASLARRAYLDLWGLPPTAAQIREFTDDSSSNAWEKLVDKLLASPHYGEKWGRHWLDLVRYSDTAGFELDSYIHDAWRYRDWVIQSFNEDKPYNRFIQEQVAGDELFPEDPVARTGTGLYCVGPNRDLFPDQADINREEILTDYADTTSAVFLGLTAGCARCHDHKFDPISQEDHYRIRAVFAPAVKTKVALNRLGSLGFEVGESVREWKLREIGEQIRGVQGRCQTTLRMQKLKSTSPEVQEAIRTADDARTPKQRELATQFGDAARVSDDEIRACLTPEESTRLAQVERSLIRMYADYRAKPFACGLTDMWNVSPRTFLPARGSRSEREVQPGFFTVLGGGEVPAPAEKREATGPIPLQPTTGRRTALANWISDPANPLTSRVMVNRVWQYHFGRGLLATPSDFGTRSGKPSHPELLDWLASEFVEKGWSLKQLHRLIMLSSTYQQQSNPSKETVGRDPANLLLSHFSRRRLSAEEVRDGMLLATGSLNIKQGGRPVVPPLSAEEKATLTQRPEDAWVLTTDTAEYLRRSVYMIQKRTFRLPMMDVFDSPESMLTCSRRDSSTTAPQALTLFNGGFTLEMAHVLATRIDKEHGSSPDAAVRATWSQVLARDPSASELRRATEFLKLQTRNTGQPTEALTELVRGLLNLNEFLYVD